MRFLIAVMIVAVFVSVAPEVRANPKIGIHAGADTGFPLVGAGITSEVIGVRHVFEYPIWELTPSFMLSFAVKDVEYSLGVTFGLVSELDCDDEYCDSFDFPQMGLRFGYRPSLEGNLQWRVGLSFSSTLIVAPGFIYDGDLTSFLIIP